MASLGVSGDASLAATLEAAAALPAGLTSLDIAPAEVGQMLSVMVATESIKTELGVDLLSPTAELQLDATLSGLPLAELGDLNASMDLSDVALWPR